MLRIPGVEGAAYSWFYPSHIEGDLVDARALNTELAPKVNVRLGWLEPDFLSVYRIRLLAGRNFSPDHGEDREPEGKESRIYSGLLNMSAVRSLGFQSAQEALGKLVRIRAGTAYESTIRIIGVIPDLLAMGTKEKVEPTIYSWVDGGGWFLTLRVSRPFSDILPAVQDAWERTFPMLPFHATPLNQKLAGLNSAHELQKSVLSRFSIAAIFIASMGIFVLSLRGVTLFRSEVAIRKLLGASRGRIAVMVLRRILQPVFWAAAMGLPIAWILAQRWLEGFAYRIELGPGPFVEALALLLLVAAVTVSGHLVRLLHTRPIAVLREG